MSSIRRYSSTKGMSDSQCRTLSPASADRIAESLAGRARVLWELSTGQNPVQDSGATPTNPQGLIGVDRSGAPWGDALMHPLLVADGKVGDANIYSQDDVLGPYARVEEVGQAPIREFMLINRPFAYRDKTPYSRGYVSVLCTRSPSGSALCLLELYSGLNLVGQQTIDVNSAGINYNVPNEVYFPLVPGVNHLALSFKVISFSGGCTRAELNSWSINQIERREHA